MSSEGFAFNIWYIRKFGPHAAISGGGFTPVRAWMDWAEGRR